MVNQFICIFAYSVVYSPPPSPHDMIFVLHPEIALGQIIIVPHGAIQTNQSIARKPLGDRNDLKLTPRTRVLILAVNVLCSSGVPIVDKLFESNLNSADCKHECARRTDRGVPAFESNIFNLTLIYFIAK